MERTGWKTCGEAQGTITAVWAGLVTWMIPAHVHRHLEVLFKAHSFPIITVGEPGAQGAGVTGTQGTGEPSAAITAGFVGAEHMPNGMMLVAGTWSMIVAAGGPPAMTLFAGRTVSGLGAAPKLQASMLPELTRIAINV